MKTTTDQVRQILMNELGLTRESVRDEMEKIVGQTIKSHVEGMLESGRFKDIVLSATTNYVKNSGWDREMIRGFIRDTAREKALVMFDEMYPSNKK